MKKIDKSALPLYRSHLSLLLVITLIIGTAIRHAAHAGDSSFYELCKSGTADQIKQAIKGGAKINEKDQEGGTCLIWAAAFNRDVDAVQAILDAGADPLIIDKSGFTALASAATNRNAQISVILAGAESKARKQSAYKHKLDGINPAGNGSRSKHDPILERALDLTRERQAEAETTTPQEMSQDDFVSRAVALTKERQQKKEIQASLMDRVLARASMSPVFRDETPKMPEKEQDYEPWAAPEVIAWRQKRQQKKDAQISLMSKVAVNHLAIQTSDQTPEDYAEAMQIGKSLDRPAGLIALDMDRYRAMDGNRKLARIMDQFPGTSRFLAEKENAIVASADIDLLEKLEWESRSWIYRGAVKGVDFVRSVPYGAVRTVGNFLIWMSEYFYAADGIDILDGKISILDNNINNTANNLNSIGVIISNTATLIAPPKWRKSLSDDLAEHIFYIIPMIVLIYIWKKVKNFHKNMISKF